MGKKVQLPGNEKFTCDDFEYFVGKNDLRTALEKIYEEECADAWEHLRYLWFDNLNTPIKFNAEYIAKIRQCYFELAEAEIEWHSSGKHPGRLLWAGVAISKAVAKIGELRDFIDDRNNRGAYEKE